MARIERLMSQAAASGQRRREIFVFAKSRRSEWLKYGYGGEVANRRTYEAILRRLTPEEERELKRQAAKRRRNAGTYHQRQLRWV